ncbi:hypothetical protein PR048_002418 [Dryococelus australis]|uniref:Uncharacterized protein n=1 Tax=Dryococelus australis TaxID=614101 RepID=A0ABQ9IK95_9NEOP|nr:hypothetical protein PR048_002418 [Dryococelus australis]
MVDLPDGYYHCWNIIFRLNMLQTKLKLSLMIYLGAGQIYRQYKSGNFKCMLLRNVLGRKQPKRMLQNVVQELESNNCREIIKARFLVKNENVFQNVSENRKKWVSCIPESLRKKMSLAMHIAWGHYGVSKTVKYI